MNNSFKLNEFNPFGAALRAAPARGGAAGSNK